MMLSQKYMNPGFNHTINPGFNHTNQCTAPVQTNTESYKVLHPLFAEILVCKVDQFFASHKSWASTESTCR